MISNFYYYYYFSCWNMIFDLIIRIHDLIDREAQFIIFFTGTDAVFGQAVQVLIITLVLLVINSIMTSFIMQANRVFSPADIVEKRGHFSDMISFYFSCFSFFSLFHLWFFSTYFTLKMKPKNVWIYQSWTVLLITWWHNSILIKLQVCKYYYYCYFGKQDLTYLRQILKGYFILVLFTTHQQQ